VKSIIKKLIAFEIEERLLREELLNSDQLLIGYHPRLRELHENQANAVIAFTSPNLWPTLKQLGDEAYEALFLVVLNAISKPDFMKEGFKHFSSQRDKTSKLYTAYLCDRISYFQRKPQVYGTQWDINVHGEMALWPVETPATMDAMRQSVGLEPFEDLDFDVVEMTLGLGLKRQISHYHFLYDVNWLTATHMNLMCVLNTMLEFDSGAIMGFNYSLNHYLNRLAHSQSTLDFIIPLQHKDAFDEFISAKGHVVLTKGLKHGCYSLKTERGYIEIECHFLSFEEGEEDWVIAPPKLKYSDFVNHTVNGLIVSKEGLQSAKRSGVFNFSVEIN
jgi:hypothetical protein